MRDEIEVLNIVSLDSGGRALLDSVPVCKGKVLLDVIVVLESLREEHQEF